MYSRLVCCSRCCFQIPGKKRGFKEGFPLANPWRGCDPSCGKVYWQELVPKTTGLLVTEHRLPRNSSDQEAPFSIKPQGPPPRSTPYLLLNVSQLLQTVSLGKDQINTQNMSLWGTLYSSATAVMDGMWPHSECSSCSLVIFLMNQI